MNKKTLLFFVLALMVSPFAFAQSVMVSGQVISSDDGYGLPGVTIQLKGTTIGTVTDLDGNYSIKADNQDVLVFSFVGYKTKEVPVKGKTKINVTLEVDAQMLDDVVVTALGIKRQKRELGYATEEIGCRSSTPMVLTVARRVSPSVVTTASLATTSPLSSSTVCR